MFINTSRSLALLACTLLLAGCNTEKSFIESNSTIKGDIETNKPIEYKMKLSSKILADYNWHLSSSTDKNNEHFDELETIKNQVSLNFYSDNNSQLNLGFSVGCNAMSSNYSIKNNLLKVDDILSTEIYCDELSDQEELIKKLMTGTSKLNLKTLKKSHHDEIILTQEKTTGEVLKWEGVPKAETKYQQVGDIVYWEVHHNLQVCPATGIKNCLKVRPVFYDEKGIKKGTGNWNIHVKNIEGYEHNPKLDTVLKLKRFTVDPVNVKGKQFEYVLDKVIESSVVEYI